MQVTGERLTPKFLKKPQIQLQGQFKAIYQNLRKKDKNKGRNLKLGEGLTTGVMSGRNQQQYYTTVNSPKSNHGKGQTPASTFSNFTQLSKLAKAHSGTPMSPRRHKLLNKDMLDLKNLLKLAKEKEAEQQNTINLLLEKQKKLQQQVDDLTKENLNLKSGSQKMAFLGSELAEKTVISYEQAFDPTPSDTGGARSISKFGSGSGMITVQDLGTTVLNRSDDTILESDDESELVGAKAVNFDELFIGTTLTSRCQGNTEIV